MFSLPPPQRSTMELACKDNLWPAVRARSHEIVALVHATLGCASIATISRVPGKDAILIETATGSFETPWQFWEAETPPGTA